VLCLVIADVHGNLAAMEAVISAAGDFDEIWCLGDMVGYGPDPNECVSLLQQFPHVAVAGNHDWAAVGLVSLDDFNPWARAAAEWTAENLEPSVRAYLQNLPVEMQKEKFTLVHGSPRSPVWEYIDSAPVAWRNMELLETPYCLVGHTHVPALFVDLGAILRRARHVRVAGDVVRFKFGRARVIANPGSVGQPRDGDYRAAYMILDTEAGQAEIRRVAYDVEATQRRMLELGLPSRNAYRLSLGH